MEEMSFQLFLEYCQGFCVPDHFVIILCVSVYNCICIPDPLSVDTDRVIVALKAVPIDFGCTLLMLGRLGYN